MTANSNGAPAPGREDGWTAKELLAEYVSHRMASGKSPAHDRHLASLENQVVALMESGARSEGTGPEAPETAGRIRGAAENMLRETAWLKSSTGLYKPEREAWDGLRSALDEAVPASVSPPGEPSPNPNPQNPTPRGEKETP